MKTQKSARWEISGTTNPGSPKHTKNETLPKSARWMLGERSVNIARWMLGERSGEFARRACSAMLGGISGVDNFELK